MQILGTVKLTHFPDYIERIAAMPIEELDDLVSKVRDTLKTTSNTDNEDNWVSNAVRTMNDVGGYVISGSANTRIDKYLTLREKTAERLRQFETFADEFGQSVQVGRWSPLYAYLFFGNPQKGIVVFEPDKYLDFTPATDYSDMTPAEMRALLGPERGGQSANLVPADAETGMTPASLREGLSAHENAIADLEREIDETKKAKTADLAEIKAQIEKLEQELRDKKATMLAELNEKMREMERQKELMENQIWLLDSQIYAIRCYAGEVVNFAHILKGKNAADTEPIVIHQKLRFLDEELGRLASLYEIEWSELNMFERFLMHSPLALDTFAPNERCVVLVRLSRSGKQLGNDEKRPYQNMMKEYDYYHGRTVGIIIRNGENVYLGWTDEDRVHIDDDLIISQVITSVEPDKTPEFRWESDRERYEKEQREQRKRLLDGVISRTFVYNILQGIVDNSKLLPLPDGVKLNTQSEYVVYAVADKWLSDNRFGSFNDIVAKVNKRVQEGDMLLTTQRLVAEREYHTYGGYQSRSWDNVRGRGAANRTHDVCAQDCTLYPANLVEYDKPVRKVHFKRLIKPDKFCNPNGEPYYREMTQDTDTYERQKAQAEEDVRKGDATSSVFDDDKDVEFFEYAKRHVFVSLKKSGDYWYGRESSGTARANFELYAGEFINLTYLNSVWLEWCITNRKLGGWTIAGHEVEYSYAIRYLKTAMDFVRKREIEEKALIDAVDAGVCKDPDWPLKLSEWKLAKGVRQMTAYQAKRFVKHIRENTK